jgi:hypothetical protein
MPRGMRTSTLFIVVLAGCGGSTKSEPIKVAPPADPVVAYEQPPVAPADPVPVEDPAVTTRKRAEAALARIPTIKTALATLRGLAFKQEVPAEYQPTEEFRAFVDGEVATELPAAKAEPLATALHHIGLLATPIDLAKTLGDAFVSQAGAYYDPKQKKFFIVMVPTAEIALDTISAHELTHALQDQHFNLETYLSPKNKPLDEDQANARKFIVEGEATLTMFAYAGGQSLPAGTSMLDAKTLPMFKMALKAGAAMTIDDFKTMTKQQAAGAAIDPEIQKSLDAMDAIPPVILVPLLDSYMKGSVAVLAAFEAGGWTEVANLYKNPPQSTEQVLHPDTKLYPKRDLPKAVTLPKLAGFTEVYSNTIGELEWRVYFMLWKKAVAEKAAEGWDGDRFSVVKGKDGGLVGLVVTTWDTPEDATEFATEYAETVANRFPKQERKAWVKVKGSTVYVVDGGTDDKLIDKLIKGTKVK